MAALKDPEAEEVVLRSSISRSYYAGYHLAKQVESECPTIDTTGMGMHEALIKTLTSPIKKTGGNDNKLRQIGYVLQQGKTMRVKVDYKMDCDIKYCEAEKHYMQMKKITGIVDNILKSNLLDAS